jgi:hypothetical protein
LNFFIKTDLKNLKYCYLQNSSNLKIMKISRKNLKTGLLNPSTLPFSHELRPLSPRRSSRLDSAGHGVQNPWHGLHRVQRPKSFDPSRRPASRRAPSINCSLSLASRSISSISRARGPLISFLLLLREIPFLLLLMGFFASRARGSSEF